MSDYSLAFEVFKTFTPYILATVVYYFWHVQKGKEVIASESKNVIIQLNEVKDSGDKLFTLILDKFNTRNIEEPFVSKEELKTLENGLNNYELKVKDALNSLDFLVGAINDKNIIKIREMAFMRFYCVLDAYHSQIFHIELNEQKYLEAMIDQHDNLMVDISKLKKKLYVYALYKANTIHKFLKF